MGRIRPRTRRARMLKHRRCPQCGVHLNKKRRRCKNCHQTVHQVGPAFG